MSEAISLAEAKKNVGEALGYKPDVQNKAGLFKKLAEVMASVTRLKKTGTNNHFKYKFATAEDVSDLIRGELADRGVWFSPSMIHAETGGGKTRCDFVMTFFDGETGASYSAQWSSEADDRQDKGINKAATAAVKYFLLKTFLVSTGDEVDADADGPQLKGKAPSVSTEAKALISGICSADSVEQLEAIGQTIKNAGLSPSELKTVRIEWSAQKRKLS